MHVGSYVALVHGSEQALADAFRTVAEHHGEEPDIAQMCRKLASWSDAHVQALVPHVSRYSEDKGEEEPRNLEHALFGGPRTGGLGLLRDLHDLWLLANGARICWTVLQQAADAIPDDELKSLCESRGAETDRQIQWLCTRIKQAAPQALVVA
jgi:hypothetical protein